MTLLFDLVVVVQKEDYQDECKTINQCTCTYRTTERTRHFIKAWSFKGISEEDPQAKKEVNLVLDIVQISGIAKKVAILKPVAVVKG